MDTSHLDPGSKTDPSYIPRHCITAPRGNETEGMLRAQQDALHKNPEADEEQDPAPQEAGLPGQPDPEALADQHAPQTDQEGDQGDDQGGANGHEGSVGCDGKAHGQGVDRGCQPLEQQGGQAQFRGCPVLLPAPDGPGDHLAPDEAQEEQGDPGDERLKGPEALQGGVDAQPTHHGHEGLKEGEDPRNEADPPYAHPGFIQAVGQGDRKGIHGQAHAQQRAVSKERKGPIHIVPHPHFHAGQYTIGIHQKQRRLLARHTVKYR